MNNLNIDPALVEKVSKAFAGADSLRWNKESVEAAIRTVFEELGLQEEKNRLSSTEVEHRYISDWKIIKP